MKFGKILAQERLAQPKLGNYLISYKDLKKAIKLIRKELNDDPEGEQERYSLAKARFIELLENEMSKINKFVELEYDVILSEQQSLRRVLKKKLSSSEVDDLESKIEDIVKDVSTLESFAQLNFTGFRKIIKKFDRRCLSKCGHPISSFMQQVSQQPFMRLDVDLLLSNISDMYKFWRAESTRLGIAPPGLEESQDDRTRRRRNPDFWIKPNQTTAFKSRLLKSTRIRRRQLKDHIAGWDTKSHVSTRMTRLYFDDDELSHYKAAVQTGKDMIRLTWAADAKTYAMQWGDLSAELSASEVSQLLAGELDVQNLWSTSSVQQSKVKALCPIQDEILKGVRPRCRCVYTRTEFDSDSLSSAVALEEDVRFIMEGPKEKWNRDIQGAYIVNEVVPFAYSLVRVQGLTPSLLALIEEEGDQIEVNGFSKGTQGIAALYPSQIPFPPLSYPQRMGNAMSDKSIDTPKLKPRPSLAESRRMSVTVSLWQRIWDALVPRVDLQVDVKTFLAHERTLLRWLHTIALLFALATTLMNLGSSASVLGGKILALFTIGLTVLAFVDYRNRGQLLIKREATYDSSATIYLALGALFGISTIYIVSIGEHL
eukprot:GEMP01028818.1.p1 GENE.GEMP01028818.1~~GEMP01028818.1.p1  ORF type:complete len:598 (+),score=118.95 GEMP01028818.1:25-1818(+)